ALGRVKTLNVLKSVVTSVEALDAIVGLEPDVAVVSTHQADGLCKGFEIVRQARQMFVKTRCVLLMDDSDHELVIDAFRAGARGVFKRSASMNLLGRCISAVHSGQIGPVAPTCNRCLKHWKRRCLCDASTPRATYCSQIASRKSCHS